MNLEDLNDEDFEKEYIRRKQEKKKSEIGLAIAEINKANSENRIYDMIITKSRGEIVGIQIYFGEVD